MVRRGTMFPAPKPVLALKNNDLRQETPPSTCRAGVEEKLGYRGHGGVHGAVARVEAGNDKLKKTVEKLARKLH